MNTTKVSDNVNVVTNEESKLKFGEKVAATINGATGSFHTQMISMFLLFFYTDMMKIDPAYVAVLFLVTRIAAAIISPVFGLVVDKISTPWGKYKPWYILIGVLTGVTGWLTFTVFDFSTTGKLVYVTVTYVLYTLIKAMAYGPGSAIGPTMTKRLDDRMSINQISYFLMIITIMFVQIGIQPLYKKIGGGDGTKGFSIIMGALAIISILIGIYQSFAIKERYIVQKNKEKKKVSIKEMIALVFTNKTAVISFMYTLGINLSTSIKTGVTMYYFKYYFENEGLVALTGAVTILPTLIGVALSPKITKRIGVKRNMFIGSLIAVITMAGVIAVPPTQVGVVMYVILLVIGALFTGFSTPVQGTLMPAAMDYTEWKTGKNVNAFMGSFSGFLQTVANAISGSVVAGSLAFIGYVGGAAEQSSGTILGLKVLMSIAPAIAMALTLIIVKFDLTEEKQAQISKDLTERRKKAEAEAEN